MKDLILELLITTTPSQKEIKYDRYLGGLIVLVQRGFVRGWMNASAYVNPLAHYGHELYCPKAY
jgi:hypothetical protein